MIRRFVVVLVAAFVAMAPAASADPKQVVSTFGTSGTGAGEFGAPIGGVAVDQSTGDTYLVDAANDRVQRFDADGAFEDQFGINGTGDGQFAFGGTAAGVAVDQSSGTVYVADTTNNRVQVFSAAGAYQSQFGTTGSGDGELASPVGVAVDPSSGKVFVADRDNNRVQRFSAAGVFEAQFGTPGSGYGELSSPTGVAVDSTGAVYVLDSGNGRVQKFTGNGSFQSVFSPGTLNLSPQALAVDSATNHVFVDQFTPDFSGTQILELTPAGNVVDTHGTGLPGAGGLDVRQGSGRIVASDAYGSRGLILDTAIVPDATAGDATAVTTTTATLNGTISAHDGMPVTYHFETSTDQSTWTSIPNNGPVTGNTDTPVTANITGLQPNTPYYARLVATPALNPPATTGEIIFTTQALAPTVDVTGARDIATDEAQLIGTVNPNGSATTYWFEYGATTAYGASVPAAQDADAGNGQSAAMVTQTLSGLQPDTTYHYRLVAHNSAGTTVGDDRQLTTRSTAAPGPGNECGGDPSTCRVYEQVSPADKAGNAVNPSWLTGVRASPDGERLAFTSPGTLPGSESGPRVGVYVATRSSDGWATRGVSPPQDTRYGILGITVGGLSQDLKQSLVWSRRALAPGAREGDANVYIQDNVTGGRTFVAGSSEFQFWQGDLSGTSSRFFRTASDDFRHVVVSSFSVPLTPDTPSELNPPHTYEIVDGVIRLANVAPDGSPLSDRPFDRLQSFSTSRSISADGRRVFFADGTLRLFMREDGATTIELSKSQRVSDPDPPQAAYFAGASADGASVFFADYARLTDEATPAPASGPDPFRLYRYKDGALDEIAFGPLGDSFGFNVLNVSDDGRTVYFVAPTALNPTGSHAPHLYIWQDGGGLREIGEVEAGGLQSLKWSMTPDGRYLAFHSKAKLTSQETRNPDCDSGRCQTVYVYDAVADRLRCVSCDPHGGLPSPATLGGASSSTELGRYYPRAVVDDGTVFFDTRDRLTVGDTDGKLDVYAWRDGHLSLITPGTTTDATFGDATADGRSVFFVTEDGLVGQDVDGNRDVYVARIGGGLASQNPTSPPPPCVGDACQGASSVVDRTSSPAGSVTLTGPGAVRSPRRSASKSPQPPMVKTTTVRGPHFAIAVKVPNAGSLKLSGNGVRAGFRTAARAGTYRVPLTLTEAARHRLKRKHRLKLKLRVAYARRSGATSTTTVTVTVKAR